MREIQASGGFISFDAPIAYFGLGEFQKIERVDVRWSTGESSDPDRGDSRRTDWRNFAGRRSQDIGGSF